MERVSIKFFSQESYFPKSFLSELEQKAKDMGFKKIRLWALGDIFRSGRIGSLIEKSKSGYLRVHEAGFIFYVKDLEKSKTTK